MLSTLSRLVRPAASDPHRYLFPRIIEGLGSELCKVENFEERLLPSIRAACDYLDDQILSIPGALGISQQSFYDLDIASRLFGAPADIGAALGKSLDMKSALPGLAQQGKDCAYALLGMRARRSHDIKSLAPTFTDHTLATLAPSENDLRKFLRDIVFMRFVNNCASFQGGLPQPGFRSAGNRSGEEKLDSLIDLLNSPEQFFRLEASGFSIPSESRLPVELPLLHCSDRRQWIVCLVRFQVQEALEALNREPNKHRYIYL